MTCDRCYKPVHDDTEHGVGLCPFEPRRATAVIGDDIPGGLMVEHGLCNPDGSPRRYDTKSSMRDEAKRRGLIPWVEHKGSDRGSDKSPFTSRWV